MAMVDLYGLMDSPMMDNGKKGLSKDQVCGEVWMEILI